MSIGVEKKKKESCYARATTQLSKFHTLTHVCTHIQSNVWLLVVKYKEEICKCDIYWMGRGDWVSRFLLLLVLLGEGGDNMGAHFRRKKMVTLIQNSRPIHTSPIMRI